MIFNKQSYLNRLIIFTFAMSTVHEVLFHLGLVGLLLYGIGSKTQHSLTRQHWLYLAIMLQFPAIMVLRKALSGAIDTPMWEGILRWCLMGYIPVLFYQKALTPSLKTLTQAAASATLIAGLVALKDIYWLNLDRAHGSEHPINYATIIALMSSLTFYGALKGIFRDKRKLVLIMICFAFGGYGFIMSQARGPLLAILITIPTIAIVHYRKFIFKPIYGFIAIIFTCIIVGSFYLAADKTGLIDRTIAEIRVYENEQVIGSFGTRIEMWKSAIDIFLQKPIFGAGVNVGQLQQEGGKYIHFSPVVSHWAHVHNEALEAMSKRGLIGLTSITLVWLLPMIIRLTNKNSTLFRFCAAQSLLFCWFLCGLTQVITSHNIGMTLLPLMFGLVLIDTRIRDSRVDAGDTNERSYEQSP
jgi:O-antigen ligase